MNPSTIGDHEVHEAAQIFPLAGGDDLLALAADIQDNGLQLPIELCDGKIIDGRRRYLACEGIDVEPDIIEVDPEDPVAYVLSMNLHRRHLDESQRSMVAGRAKEIYATAAKERKKEAGHTHGRGQKVPDNLPEPNAGDARDQAGKAANVSGKSVDRAATVLFKGVPELAEAVDSGDVAVSLAAKVADLPKPEQKKAVKAFNAGDKSALKDAVKPTPKPPKHLASDRFFSWMTTISFGMGMIEKQYGSLTEMVNHSTWNDSETIQAARLLKAVAEAVAKFHKEMKLLCPKQ